MPLSFANYLRAAGASVNGPNPAALIEALHGAEEEDLELLVQAKKNEKSATRSRAVDAMVEEKAALETFNAMLEELHNISIPLPGYGVRVPEACLTRVGPDGNIARFKYFAQAADQILWRNYERHAKFNTQEIDLDKEVASASREKDVFAWINSRGSEVGQKLIRFDYNSEKTLRYAPNPVIISPATLPASLQLKKQAILAAAGK